MENAEKNQKLNQSSTDDPSTNHLGDAFGTKMFDESTTGASPNDDPSTDKLGDTHGTKMLGSEQHGTRILGDQAGVVSDNAEKTEPLPVVPTKLRVIMPDGKIAIFDSVRPHLLVGRRTMNNKANIDIDLNPYDAGMKGVSRLHAKIAPDERYGLSIKDIDSVNGTFINGELLRTQTAYPLKSGDNIKFGNLKIQIFFGYD